MRQALVGALIGAALVAALAWTPASAMAQGRAATDANLSGAIDCAALEQQSFSGLADAPTAIISARAMPAREGADGYCAVIGVVQPQIQFELRLPTRWNGRYFQTGCGGLCGNVPIENCGDAQARGFAVAAHNMGHVGHFWRDALWASEPALRRDFGRRSTHVVALAAKAIIERYYGARAAYSYFRGCSTGGREGLSEAQFFPEDFDGIIAGDPAFPGRQGPLANNWDAQNLLTADNQPVFSPAALRTLADAVMRACDRLDGVRDGIIDDPRYCRFDPRSIACGSDEQVDTTCLTAAQVRAAQRLYAGAHDSRGQALSIGGSPFGAELQWDGAGRRSIAEAWLRFLAFSEPRPSYSYRDFNFDTDVAATEASAAMFDPVPPRGAPDLSAFERRGGKLIIYHGWADPGVSPLATLDYYAHIAARQGGIDSVRNWFRVFMVPGMYHCRGGNAPNTFDFLPHLMRWVEGGTAPDGVVATQTENGAIVRTRPLYAYPNVARYTRSGDVNDAANWRSAPPRRRFNDRYDWIWVPAAN